LNDSDRRAGCPLLCHDHSGQEWELRLPTAATIWCRLVPSVLFGLVQ